MPNNESNPGTGGAGGSNANDSVGGGGGAHAANGGAGQQSSSAKALFVGFIYPSPLDEHGQIPNDLTLATGFGNPQFAVAVFGYESEIERAIVPNVHAAIDKELGQPFFKAYIYPVKKAGKSENAGDSNEEAKEKPVKIINLAGGGGGHAAMGGAATLQPIYLGQFFAATPDEDNSGGGSDKAGAGDGHGAGANSPAKG